MGDGFLEMINETLRDCGSLNEKKIPFTGFSRVVGCDIDPLVRGYSVDANSLHRTPYNPRWRNILNSGGELPGPLVIGRPPVKDAERDFGQV
ncbi:hypothetical protein JAAARDRAFT_53231 [Jaapia argillacea MUCL 33604]|uniref:Uncharacterized protein n=1 Tax=Jaapia argillacea MUCL 33604 TaxID=933084 RepID=A0A067QA23_9AGAM|nr:hypothetical protein JAAARDRAFT_53231 [Jaapia argillacea MUCL 33604]